MTDTNTKRFHTNGAKLFSNDLTKGLTYKNEYPHLMFKESHRR